MELVNRLLGGEPDDREEVQGIGVTKQDLIRTVPRSQKSYFQENEGSIRDELLDLPWNVEVYLNGEKRAEDRDEAIELYENFFTGINERQDYLVGRKVMDGEDRALVIEVGPIEQVEVWNRELVEDEDSNRDVRTGYENVKAEYDRDLRDEIPESHTDGRGMTDIEYGDPEFTLRIEYETRE